MGKSNSRRPNPLLAYCGAPGRPHQRLSCLGSPGAICGPVLALGCVLGCSPGAPLGQTRPFRLPVCMGEMYLSRENCLYYTCLMRGLRSNPGCLKSKWPVRVFSSRFRGRWVSRCMGHATAKFGSLVHRFGMISVGLNARDFFSKLDPKSGAFLRGAPALLHKSEATVIENTPHIS